MGGLKKNVLITGANGFIGKNFSEQLKDKYNLLTPSRSELDLLNEVKVDNFFQKNNIDVVVHAAVVGGSRKEEQIDLALSQNLRMFFNILKNKKYFKKMIYLGSGAEYNKIKPIIEVKETDFGKTIPSDEYGFFKYICSKYIEEQDNIISLRIFGMFGKYEDYRYRFISNAICQNLSGSPITINQNVFFDYVFIDDFVKIVDYFIDNDVKHKFYNIGTGKKIDLVTIANLINEVADKKSKIIVKNKGLNNEYTCNNERLMSELDNFEFNDIRNSIKSLYNWYRNVK
ncbi:MAG: NAD(P)-dependent oxidoreductase [Candidatus Shapirobacteria bacterium]|nr:NAD(P)-dependent oxidoreductase [Candidatus Shapirobacteria bacterium]